MNDWHRIRQTTDAIDPMDDDRWNRLRQLSNVNVDDVRGVIPVLQSVAQCKEHLSDFVAAADLGKLERACDDAGNVARVLRLCSDRTDRKKFLYERRRNPRGLLVTNPAFGAFYHQPQDEYDFYASLCARLALAIEESVGKEVEIPFYFAGLALRTLAEKRHSSTLGSLAAVSQNSEVLQDALNACISEIPHMRWYCRAVEFFQTKQEPEVRSRKGGGGGGGGGGRSGGHTRGPGRPRAFEKIVVNSDSLDLFHMGPSAVSRFEPHVSNPRLVLARPEKPIYTPEDASRHRAATQRRLERGNQLLKADIETLTPYEVARLIQISLAAPASGWGWAAADMLVSVFTGIPVEDVDGLARTGVGNRCELDIATGVIRRPVPIAPVQQEPENPAWYREISPQLKTPLPNFLIEHVGELHRNAAPRLEGATAGAFLRFQSNEDMRNVTQRRVEAYWAGQVAVAGGSPCAAALLTGLELPGVGPDLHYFHISETQLIVEHHYEAWMKCVRRINAESRMLGIDQVPVGMKIPANLSSSAGFGSQYVARIESVRDRIEGLRELRSQQCERSLCEQAESLSAEASEFAMLISGARPNYALCNLIATQVPVSKDKEIHGAALRVFVAIEKPLALCVRMVRQAEELIRAFSYRIASDASDVEAAISDLLSAMMKPASSVKRINGMRPVPNYGRQLLWTSLSERGIPDWAIRANLGHVPAGTNVLDTYSAVDGRRYRDQIEKTVRNLDYIKWTSRD